MRISSTTVAKLKRAIHLSFGKVPVYLFGSREDDNAVGGDIDIAIDSQLNREIFAQKRVLLKTELVKMGFTEISVDVVPYYPKDELLAQAIQKTAIRLF